MIRKIFIATCLVLTSATSLAAPDDTTLARPESGPVRGHAVNGVVAFRGIPFAAPPIGALWWRAPHPVRKWTDERDATSFGHDCMQVASKLAPISTTAAEDCLFLNVWRPFDTHAGHNLPVLVWIHGGFVVGGTSIPAYDGRAFARHGIVFVSANYRLARPGFFANSALLAANEGLVGDFAYVDQVKALQWVQRNIGALGGDATRVTIIGEVQGGASVLWHLASPGSHGLFHQAIVMTGGRGRGTLTPPLEEFLRAGPVANVPVIIGADMIRDEPSRLLARTVTARGQRLWRYRIAYAAESTRLHSKQQADATDAIELPFLFRTLDTKYGDSVTAKDEQVALALNTYVTNFVKDGDPNGSGLPGWRAFAPSRHNLMTFTPEGPQYGFDPRARTLVQRAADAWAANWR